jgi:protein TonB
MTGTRRFLPGDPIAAQMQDGAGRLHSAILVARRDGPADFTAADLSNVVPFLRPRTSGFEAPALSVSPDDRAPSNMPPMPVRLRASVLMGSIAIHGLVLLGFLQPPKPLASIGIEAITVEVVLGGHSAAGLATTPGENEVQAATRAQEQVLDAQQREQERLATQSPQSIPIAPQEAAPEIVTSSVPPQLAPALAEIHPPQDEVRPQQPPAETRTEVAAIETLSPQATETLSAVMQPEVADAVTMPQPERQKPVPPKTQEPKPPAKTTAPQRKRIAAPTAKNTSQQQRTAALPSSAASGVGRGRSDLSSNYQGRVSAHLARHKRYPADAQRAGSQGVATVTFSLDGGGRVTGVQLTRGSGIASIDQEVVAMVRRASPFPPPPDGRGRSFTVPVRFNLRQH